MWGPSPVETKKKTKNKTVERGRLYPIALKNGYVTTRCIQYTVRVDDGRRHRDGKNRYLFFRRRRFFYFYDGSISNAKNVRNVVENRDIA